VLSRALPSAQASAASLRAGRQVKPERGRGNGRARGRGGGSFRAAGWTGQRAYRFATTLRGVKWLGLRDTSICKRDEARADLARSSAPSSRSRRPAPRSCRRGRCTCASAPARVNSQSNVDFDWDGVYYRPAKDLYKAPKGLHRPLNVWRWVGAGAPAQCTGPYQPGAAASTAGSTRTARFGRCCRARGSRSRTTCRPVQIAAPSAPERPCLSRRK
jgi:hypothetical protein